MSKLNIVFMCLTFTLQACTSCITSRENFRSHLGLEVGRRIDQVNPYGWATNDAHLIESKVGDDGLLEHWHKFDDRYGECVYVYKIDPESKIIKGFIIEKDTGACFVNP